MGVFEPWQGEAGEPKPPHRSSACGLQRLTYQLKAVNLFCLTQLGCKRLCIDFFDISRESASGKVKLTGTIA